MGKSPLGQRLGGGAHARAVAGQIVGEHRPPGGYATVTRHFSIGNFLPTKKLKCQNEIWTSSKIELRLPLLGRIIFWGQNPADTAARPCAPACLVHGSCLPLHLTWVQSSIGGSPGRPAGLPPCWSLAILQESPCSW